METMTTDKQLAYIKSILHLLPGNVYWKDAKGRYLGCNKNLAAIFNLKSPSDIVGKTDYDLMDKKLAEKIIEADTKIMRLNKEKILEEKGFDVNRNPAIYLSTKTPLRDDTGNIIGLLGISQNITEHKRIEKALAEVPGNVYWKDAEGSYLGCNLNVARLLNLKSPSDIVGKTDYDLMDRELAEKTIEADTRIMRLNKEESFEEKGFDKDHNPAVYLSIKRPVHDEAGKIIGLLGVSQDITERKKMEKALAEAKEKALQSSRAKSEFIHNMSHDLRTPFVGILGVTELLKHRLNNPDDKELLSYIHEASQQLLHLLNDIISAISTEDDSNCKTTTFNLEEVINDTVKLMEASIKAKNLELKVVRDTLLPTYIISDKMRLHRIMINLISNAIKFTAKGKIELTLYPDYKEQTPILVFQVTDTGIGIPEDKVDEIFERFTRLSPSYEGIYSGIGLGLYIVKQFIKDLNGSIEAQSKIGVGSTFTCRIPLETANSDSINN